MSDMDALQASIGEWAAATFPDRPTSGIVKHMRREVEELDIAVEDDGGSAYEVADVIILALNLAHRMGFSAAEAVEAKMRVNRARKWGPADSEGVREHVR